MNTESQQTQTKSDWTVTVKEATSSWSIAQPRSSTRRGVGASPKKRWAEREDAMLKLAVARHGRTNWQAVASDVEGRSPRQCRERWLGYFAPDINHDDWTPAEDLTLIEKHNEFGNQWSLIRKFLPGRQAIMVKNRWQWFCRRNIPNHSIEFAGFVRAHWMNEGVSCEAVEIIWGSDDGKDEIEIEFDDNTDPAASALIF
jgi:hypothetical protein